MLNKDMLLEVYEIGVMSVIAILFFGSCLIVLAGFVHVGNKLYPNVRNCPQEQRAKIDPAYKHVK